MKYGLTETTVKKICAVFARFPEIEKAVLYGSRAKGNFKTGSDIDLMLYGESIVPDQLSAITSALDDLLLPYTIDLSVFDDLSHAKLREHIERVGVVFYERVNQCAGMKKGWEERKLRDVCEFEKTPKKQNQLPYVGLEHIESNTGLFIGSHEPIDVKSLTFQFDNSHILYGRLRPYLNKVLKPDFIGHCSTEIFPIKPFKSIDRNYLFDWFLSDSTVNKINATCTGARMPRADMNEVLDFIIPLPPLPEQKRIVGILDKAFAAISTAKANAEKNLQNARELLESYLQGIFANPGDGWERCNLEDYIKFIDYRGKTPEKTESGMRLITAKNVKKGYLQIEPREYVHPRIYKTWMTRGIPKIGDVLFTTEAPLANVAQLDTEEKVVFSQRIIIFQPMPNKLDQTFLKYLLLSKPIQERIHAKSTGATVKGIKARWLKKIPIEFPLLAQQRSIVVKLDPLSAETKKLEAIYKQKLADLDELKKSVLQKAFNGELAEVQS